MVSIGWRDFVFKKLTTEGSDYNFFSKKEEKDRFF